MNLGTIRALVMENASPRGRTQHPQVDRIINRAVEHVVNLVELLAKDYNTALTAITVSVTSGTLTYALNASNSPVIRKINQAERTDVAGGPVNVTVIPFRHKNKYGAGRYPWTDWGAAGIRPFVFFRRDNLGIWYLGFPVDPQASMTIDVYYAPQITELSEDTDVPREVPEQHHELIALRATILLLNQSGLDSRPWDRQYAELRAVLDAELESWNRTGPRVRQFHVSRA